MSGCVKMRLDSRKHRHIFVIRVENINTPMSLAFFLVLQFSVFQHVGQGCFTSVFCVLLVQLLARLVNNFCHSFWILPCVVEC